MKRDIACASASGSRAGTRKPFAPSSTVSRQPVISVKMIGRAVAIASMIERGCPLGVVRRQNEDR
jgi:hypothetical protein